MKLGPERRVRKRPDFQAIQKHGRRVSTPHFVLIIAPAGDAGAHPRLGITASKRVGNSVRRSRLKRLVREAFRGLGGFVPDGFDLVVICKKDSAALKTQTVVQEWKDAEKRLKKALAASTRARNTQRTQSDPPPQ